MSEKEPPQVDRITAPLGTEEYNQQFQLQTGAAIQRFANMSLVRIVCGLLTVLYILLVIGSSAVLVRSQINDGFDAWEVVLHVSYLVVMWWVISMQGRIALYGEFSTQLSLKPRTL